MTLVPTDADPQATIASLTETLAAERANVDLLNEELGDLEVAAEDRGWRIMSRELERELSRDGLANVIRNCTLMSIASPLIKRGLQLRIGYVWGQGYTIQARAADPKAGAGGQDVNAVIQTFLDDPINQKVLTSIEAQEENERTLGTEGNLCLTFFPNPLTGRVQVRVTPFEEIQDKIANPDDRDDTWFFYRQYTAHVLEPGYAGTVRRRRETRRVLHPALGYWPKTRPKTIDNLPVVWDQPILHVTVNRPKHAKWGIPDAYAALPWARGYEDFLTDWARLVKALSKFAWRLSGDKSAKARRAAQAMAAAVPTELERVQRTPGGPGLGAGQVAAMGPGQSLEAIPKTGATIDAGSGRPLAALVAAALGVSVVDLLADPGVTGARAVAETLDKPITFEMGSRRRMWSSVMQTVLGYVVDQAVRAPRGPLRGSVNRDPVTDRETITITGDEDGTARTVVIDWPDLNELDPTSLITAIVAADGTDLMPPLETLRLLLTALKVDDVDEVLASVTDENGEFVDRRLKAAIEAVAEHRRAA